MSFDTPRKVSRRTSWLGGVAVAAMLATGIGVNTFAAVGPLHAQPLSSPSAPIVQMPSFADVVDRVKPAVVSVRVKVEQVASRDGERAERFGFDNSEDLPPALERFLRRFGEGEGMGEGFRSERPRRFAQQSQGSGFFISADGYVVTNNHVVRNATTVEIVTDAGKTLSAKVIGTDPKTDIALLKVNEEGTYPFVQFAKGDTRIGDWVVAVGNPFGLGGTVTAGIVSARGRDIGAGPYDDFLQIDAPVNRGNSGGPTFNLAGEVVGINTAIASPTGGNVGIAFAIPAAGANRVVAELKENGSVSRGFIGVQIQPVTKEISEAMGLKDARGALIAETVAGSPAERAGLRSGDVITAVDGKELRDARDLSRRIAGYEPGKKVELTVKRKGDERKVDLEIGRQSGA